MDTYDARHESAGSGDDVTIFYELRESASKDAVQRPSPTARQDISIHGTAPRFKLAQIFRTYGMLVGVSWWRAPALASEVDGRAQGRVLARESVPKGGRKRA